MTRHVFGFMTMTALAVAMVAAQGRGDAPPREPPKTVDLTLTGCVLEGTDAGVYILNNAVAEPRSENAPRVFRLVSGGDDLDLSLHANHQVQATGRAEIRPVPDPPPNGRVDPRDLPAFAVKTIHSIADRCVG